MDALNDKPQRGIESLKNAVLKDCKDGNQCFSETGCNDECRKKSKCIHNYCDKYKWAIERASHYAEKTGKTRDQILEMWETHRSYWYMNYYQECNQPLLNSDKTIFYDDWVKQLNERFGEKDNWAFVCPACGHVQTVKEFKDFGIEIGAVTQNCIGRYKKNEGGCDWSAGGLLNICKTNVIKDGIAFPVFGMAESSKQV